MDALLRHDDGDADADVLRWGQRSVKAAGCDGASSAYRERKDEQLEDMKLSLKRPSPLYGFTFYSQKKYTPEYFIG